MNDKLNEALDHIGDVHLYESIRPRRRRTYWFYVIAAILALALILVPILSRDRAHRDTDPEVPYTTAPLTSAAASTK